MKKLKGFQTGYVLNVVDLVVAIITFVRGVKQICEVIRMGDCMTFPDTVEEFMEQYKIVDTEGIYMSKGSELVPIFRMKQWFEHKPERKTGEWIFKGYGEYRCSSCRRVVDLDMEILMSIKSFDYCPYCGSYNGGE